MAQQHLIVTGNSVVNAGRLAIGSTIRDVLGFHPHDGIYIDNVDDSTITNNRIVNSLNQAMYVGSCGNCTIQSG